MPVKLARVPGYRATSNVQKLESCPMPGTPGQLSRVTFPGIETCPMPGTGPGQVSRASVTGKFHGQLSRHGNSPGKVARIMLPRYHCSRDTLPGIECCHVAGVLISWIVTANHGSWTNRRCIHGLKGHTCPPLSFFAEVRNALGHEGKRASLHAMQDNGEVITM